MTSIIESNQEQILIHKKNLSDLEIKKAKFGSLDVPIYILRQIEEEKNEISRLEIEIKRINFGKEHRKLGEKKGKKLQLAKTMRSSKKRTGSKIEKFIIPILIALIGLVGTLITAYVNYLAPNIPIAATQTAESKIHVVGGTNAAPLDTPTLPPAYGQVKGKIVSADLQSSIEGLFLILVPAESAPYGQVGLKISPSSPRTTTNLHGEFVFVNVPIGKYVLLAGGMKFIGIVDPSGYVVFEIITNGQVVDLGLLAAKP